MRARRCYETRRGAKKREKKYYKVGTKNTRRRLRTPLDEKKNQVKWVSAARRWRLFFENHKIVKHMCIQSHFNYFSQRGHKQVHAPLSPPRKNVTLSSSSKTQRVKKSRGQKACVLAVAVEEPKFLRYECVPLWRRVSNAKRCDVFLLRQVKASSFSSQALTVLSWQAVIMFLLCFVCTSWIKSDDVRLRSTWLENTWATMCRNKGLFNY